MGRCMPRSPQTTSSASRRARMPSIHCATATVSIRFGRWTMQVRVRKNRPRRVVLAGLCLFWPVALLPAPSVACSWDYPIWMVRSKSADPLYRFLRDGKAGYIDRAGKVVIKPTLDFDGNYGGEFHDGLMAVDDDEATY